MWFEENLVASRPLSSFSTLFCKRLATDKFDQDYTKKGVEYRFWWGKKFSWETLDDKQWWLIDWLIDWLMDWLIDWYTDLFIYLFVY